MSLQSLLSSAQSYQFQWYLCICLEGFNKAFKLYFLVLNVSRVSVCCSYFVGCVCMWARGGGGLQY